ncbi:hypothetical protein [Pseudoalteromonas sp. MelDa3]|uniref:hypothetical protein n=1 Tax=Pseudoalteromonas sp. MelDa3 TaxID=888435 RepID=UPI0021532C25|nr:hypothetical protein [Pseudoalteromonas sp. MelDa3]
MMGITSMAGGAANAAALPQQALPTGAPDQTNWGNFGGFVNSALSNAMNVYAQYEGVQAMKNAAGVGRQSQEVVELDNGGAVVADVPKTQPTGAQVTEAMVFGFKQKQVIMAFGGLLVVGVLLKVAKS